MKLYTTLLRIKMAMNGGCVPPVTALGEKAKALIDPAFTPGLGVIEADPTTTALRCPIVGCGKFYHNLGPHLTYRHRNLGGASAVRAALEIPAGAPLISEALLRKRRQSDTSHLVKFQHGAAPNVKSSSRGVTIRASKRSTGLRNLYDRCDTQIAHKVIDLRNKLGRTPSSDEFAREYGIHFRLIKQAFGSWSNLLALLGCLPVPTKRPRYTQQEIVDFFAAFYARHGRLPTCTQVVDRSCEPIMPPYKPILTALGVSSWSAVLEAVKPALGIAA